MIRIFLSFFRDIWLFRLIILTSFILMVKYSLWYSFIWNNIIQLLRNNIDNPWSIILRVNVKYMLIWFYYQFVQTPILPHFISLLAINKINLLQLLSIRYRSFQCNSILPQLVSKNPQYNPTKSVEYCLSFVYISKMCSFGCLKNNHWDIDFQLQLVVILSIVIYMN